MGRPSAIDGERVGAHIQLTPPTRDLLRDFCNGAGMTYSEGILYLIGLALLPKESARAAGVRVFETIQRGEE